ncbi:unnamed protein product, partial [Ilex paraguariensis]
MIYLLLFHKVHFPTILPYFPRIGFVHNSPSLSGHQQTLQMNPSAKVDLSSSTSLPSPLVPRSREKREKSTTIMIDQNVEAQHNDDQVAKDISLVHLVHSRNGTPSTFILIPNDPS